MPEFQSLGGLTFGSWSEESFPSSGIPHPLPSVLHCSGSPWWFFKHSPLFPFIFYFPSLLFPALKSGIREVSALGIGAARRNFPSSGPPAARFSWECCNAPREPPWRCLALDLLIPSSNPIYPFANPVDFVLPTPSFSLLFPFYCPDGKGKGQEQGMVLLKAARPSAACHKLLPSSTIHTVLPFIPDPF